MKVFSKIARMSNKALVLSAITAAVVGIAGLKLATVQAQNISIGGPSDCDSNAVMYCGAHSVKQLIKKYENGDGVNRHGQIRNVYSYFGITKADMAAMDTGSTKVVAGKVTKSGKVLGPDGKVLATNALTAGREYIPGSNQVSHNGTKFYTRSPSVSFLSNTLDAYIVLNKHGEFKYAILSSCGNPVKAQPKPQPKPDYKIEKEVRVKGKQNFKKSVSVRPGTHVIYRITIKSTGDVAVTDVNVKDKLPAHVQYVGGTLRLDGIKKGGEANKFFGNGVKVDRIGAGNVKHFTFEAIVGPKTNPEKCKDERLKNVAKINAPDLPAKDSKAVVKKNCAPLKPEFSCENLQAIAGSRISYKFKAKAAAANGAKITGYKFSFGDGKTVTVKTNKLHATVTHAYPNISKEKTYTAMVTVTAKVNGKTVKHTTSACKVPVKVAPKPAAECTSLKLTATKDRVVTAQTQVTTKNGAKLVSITYDFDDGQTLLVNNLKPVTHTYAADGDYLVKATVTFNIEGKKTTSLCQAPISFVPPTPPTCEEENGGEPCVVPTCEELAAEDSSIVCVPVGKNVPTELVNTGPGSTAAAFVAVTVLGALGYRSLLRRQLNQ